MCWHAWFLCKDFLHVCHYQWPSHNSWILKICCLQSGGTFQWFGHLCIPMVCLSCWYIGKHGVAKYAFLRWGSSCTFHEGTLSFPQNSLRHFPSYQPEFFHRQQCWGGADLWEHQQCTYAHQGGEIQDFQLCWRLCPIVHPLIFPHGSLPLLCD